MFSQNAVGVSIFLLQSGQIKLVRLLAARHEKIIELIAPEHSFAFAEVVQKLPLISSSSVASANVHPCAQHPSLVS